MKRLIFCFLLVALIGCSGQIDKSALVGKYKLNSGMGSDLIELKIDGTYIHSYENSSVIKTTKTGQWTLEDIEGKKTVVLAKFEHLPGEQTIGGGFYLLQVRRSMGTMHLMTDLDLNYSYDKISTTNP